jgi:hypothetical protein
MPGIYLSPVIPEGGLKEADAAKWTKIFEIDEYEPDPVIARATSIGELASFHGRLYFSTSQVPLYATMNAFTAYGRPDDWWERVFVHVHSERATALFVMDDAGGRGEKVTLLYGEAELPAFDPATGMFEAARNNLGQEPLFGPSGIGSHFNQLTAALTVFEDRLYIGTYDDSTLGSELFGPMAAQKALLDLPVDVVAIFSPLFDFVREQFGGADLYRIDAPYAPAVAEDLNGLGNRSNLAVRVLLPFDDKGKLLAGTANPFNLRTGEEDPGGYELYSLTPMDARPMDD